MEEESSAGDWQRLANAQPTLARVLRPLSQSVTHLSPPASRLQANSKGDSHWLALVTIQIARRLCKTIIFSKLPTSHDDHEALTRENG